MAEQDTQQEYVVGTVSGITYRYGRQGPELSRKCLARIGLTDAAEADLNGDGWVTGTEAAQATTLRLMSWQSCERFMRFVEEAMWHVKTQIGPTTENGVNLREFLDQNMGEWKSLKKSLLDDDEVWALAMLISKKGTNFTFSSSAQSGQFLFERTATGKYDVIADAAN